MGLFEMIFGTHSDRELKRIMPIVNKIEALRPDMLALSDEELQAKSIDALKQELTDAKKELFNLRFQNATNQLDNTARITEVRKNIARIQTALTAKANA